MKGKAHIVCILLICFTVFLGHDLVPHHHHSEVYISPIATDCLFDHEDHGRHHQNQETDSSHGEHPAHCHAFNDVAFKKYDAPVNKSWPGKAQTLIIAGQARIAEIPKNSSYLYTSLKLPRSSHTDVGTRALRAPPALA